MNIIINPDQHADVGAANLALVRDTMTEFDKVQTGVTALAAKFGGVAFAVGTAKGLAEAKDARAEIRAPRYAVDKALKAAKAPLNALKRNLDERAQYITDQIMQIEEPVHAQICAEEERREQAKEAAARAERDRMEAITIKLSSIRAAANVLPGQKASDILIIINLIGGNVPTEYEFGDMLPAAQRAHAETLETLRQIHEAAVAHEAQQRLMSEQQAEIARQQAVLKAEADRQAAERRAEEQRAAAERKAAQDKLDAERREFEQQQAAARAEAAAIAKAEADKLAAERAAEEARAAAARREAEAAAQAERDKLAAEIAEFERVQAHARAEAAAAEKALRDAEAARLAEIARLSAVEDQRIKDEQDAEDARRRALQLEADRAASELAAAQAAALDRVQRAGPVLLTALQSARNSLVAFKFQPGECNSWEDHDEQNLAEVDAAITLATGA